MIGGLPKCTCNKHKGPVAEVPAGMAEAPAGAAAICLIVRWVQAVLYHPDRLDLSS